MSWGVTFCELGSLNRNEMQKHLRAPPLEIPREPRAKEQCYIGRQNLKDKFSDWSSLNLTLVYPREAVVSDASGLHFTVNSPPLPRPGTQRRSRAQTDRR